MLAFSSYCWSVWGQHTSEATSPFQRAHRRYKKEDSGVAQTGLTRVIELNAKVVWFYVVRFDESPFERALKDFTMGPKLNMQCAEAYGNRGLVQLLRGNDAAAEADVARCWELKRSYVPFGNNESPRRRCCAPS